MQKIDLPDGLGLRLATPNDAPFIETLFHSTREIFHVAEQEHDYIHHVIEQQLEIQTQGYGQQTPDMMTFIVDKQGTRIGRLLLDFGKNTAHIVDLALIKEARGRGYGKSVIQAVQVVAHKQTLPVSLAVEKQKEPLRKLYASLGFKVQEETPTHEFMIWFPPANKIYAGV